MANSNSIRLTLLGTGACERTPAHACACPTCTAARQFPEQRRTCMGVLVQTGNTNLLVDAGSETILDRLGDTPLDAILLSHWHSDHYTGLYMLRWSRQTAPIPLYYPAGGTPDADIEGLPLNLRLEPAKALAPFEVGPVRITPVPLQHTTHAHGYLIQTGSAAVVYLTDTHGLPEASWKALDRPLDVALIDSTYPPRGMGQDSGTDHNSVDDALDMASRLQAHRSVLVHISHGNLPHHELQEYVKSRGRDDVLVGQDGLMLDTEIG